MDDRDAQITALLARTERLEEQMADLVSWRSAAERRLKDLHKSFMAISGEVIEINEKLKAVLLKAYPALAPTIAAITRIIRPDPKDDGSRQPPNS